MNQPDQLEPDEIFLMLEAIDAWEAEPRSGPRGLLDVERTLITNARKKLRAQLASPKLGERE